MPDASRVVDAARLSSFLLQELREAVVAGSRAGGAVSAVTLLLTLMSRTRGRAAVERVLWAGGYVGSSVLLLRLVRNCLRRLRRKEKDMLSGAVAGAIAGLPVLMLSPATRASFALFALTRSVEMWVQLALQTGVWPKQLTTQHFDVVLMCITAMQVLRAYQFCPSSLPLSYQQFLVRFGDLDKLSPRTATASLSRAQPPRLGPLAAYSPVRAAVFDHEAGRRVDVGPLRDWCQRHRLDPSRLCLEDGSLRSVCGLKHPHEGCPQFWARFLIRDIKRAVRM